MSLKYQRVKQADLLLPTPLRWLTRAFSSITQAVILLSLVALYGTFASVPIAFIVKGVVYAMIFLLLVALPTVLVYRFGRSGGGDNAGKAHMLAVVVTPLLGLCAAAWAWLAAYRAMYDAAWFNEHRATVVYRLPYLEMTELQFYSWWPLKLILALFVVNMIWATIRRIEFKLPNIGVLTVHTGIVTVAIGSIFYGVFKLEGDTILWRLDLGGEPVGAFYDSVNPAIYMSDGRRKMTVALPQLPRYNDYADGHPRPLEIKLHDRAEFRQVFGPNLRATIRGFISYGTLEPRWIDGALTGGAAPSEFVNPAIRLTLGDDKGPGSDFSQLLISAVPSQRVLEQPSWAIEYLFNPPKARIDDLMAPFDGDHGLIVEIPSQQFRQVYAIREGQTITAGETGYTFTVEAIGDYGMAFATPGYQGATDTRAMVRVEHGDKTFRRIAMHRYPERSQDFVPAPEDPSAGPMGRRGPPDPAVRLTYIDASRLQYRIISNSPDNAQLQLMIRVPGQSQKPFLVDLPDNRVRLPFGNQHLYITEKMAHATQVREPVITPKRFRTPKDEGTYIHALLPVDLEIDIPTAAEADGTPAGTRTWRRRVWMTHMRYPAYPSDENKPAEVDVPTIGPVQLIFSRQHRVLPFAIALESFEMQPYPGSQIPRDFVAKLKIFEFDESRTRIIDTNEGVARLNNPLVYSGVKLSQTGWDPGDRTRPDHTQRDEQGRFVNQQRFTIMGVGNNPGIHIIFVGACLVVVGIPMAFYLKPWLVQRQKRKIQQALAAGQTPPGVAPTAPAQAAAQNAANPRTTPS